MTPDKADLMARLRHVEPDAPGERTRWLRNPDGLEAADEIERLREQLALWEWCADKTRQMYGGCFTPEYAAKLKAAARELANDAT